MARNAGWPEIVRSLLANPPEDRPALVDAALHAVVEVVGAAGAFLSEWVAEQPALVRSVGRVPHRIDRRPPQGASRLEGLPIGVAAVGAHRDLVAIRQRGAPDFGPADVAALETVATLLHHADVWNPREAAGALYQLATEVLQTLDLDRVLLSLANAAGRLLAAEVAGVFLLEGGMLHMRCAVGHRSVGTARLRIEPGHGVAGKVVETGRPERVDDYVTNPSITKDYLAIALEEGTQSALCVPVFDREGAVLGVLGVWRRRRSIFVDDDERQLVALAGLASIAVQNARLFELQREATEQVRQAQAELEERFRSADLALRVHQELTRIAAEGHHLDALARAVHGLMGGAVVVLSTDGRLLAAHPEGPNDVPLADRTARGGSARCVTTGGGVSWLVAPIEAGATPYGHLCLRLDAHPTTQQFVAVEQAATVCALLMAREEAVQSATTRLQSEFVWDLLDGRVTDGDEAQRRARTEYGLELPARLVLVHAEGFQKLSRAEDWSPEELDRARNWLGQRLGRRLEGETGQRVMVGHRGDNFAAVVGRRAGDSAAAARELGLAAVAESPFRSVELPYLSPWAETPA